MHKKNISFQWIYPLLWGTLMYNILRAITDLAPKNTFWNGEMQIHLVSLFISILVCYIFNWIWKRSLKKTIDMYDGVTSAAQEYLYVFLGIFFSLNLMLTLGQWVTIFHMGAGWIDYMLINAVYIPLLLLFYTFTRNSTVNKHIHNKVLILERMKAEKYETELRFLKSQYHPHFLFNALNTIYFQIDAANKEAKETVELLSDLLRYQLYDVNQKVTIKQEIKYIASYAAFQQLRKSKKLVLKINIDPRLALQRVHPLLFQPLLENAFKYVDSLQQIGLKILLKEHHIYFEVKNSISKTNANVLKNNGIGIENLKRRLDLLYPDKYHLDISSNDGFFIAVLNLAIE